MRCQARQRLMLLHLPTLSRRRIIGHLHGPSVRSQSTIASDPQQSSPPSPFRSRPRPRHTAALEAVATGMDVEVLVEPEMTAPTHRASRFSSRASTSIPPRGPASASSHSASRSSPDHRTPLLRANPNASNYTVSEAELDDTADFKEPIKEAPENHNLVLSTMDRLRRSLTRARTDQTNQLSARKLLKPASGSKRTISPLLHRGLRTKQVTTHLSPPSNRPTSTRRHEHRPDSSSDTTAPSATRRRVPVPRRIHMSPQEHLEVHIGYVEYVKTEPKTTTTGPEDLVTSHYPMAYSLLRDACPCPKCIHPSTRQKLHTTGQAHDAVMTSSFAAEVKDGTSIRATTDADSRQPGLEILWDSESSGFSGHRSFLPWSMIRLMARRRSPPGHYLHNQLRRLPWESAARLAETGYFRVAIEDIMLEDGRPSDEMLLNVLEQLQVHGLVIFEGVPIDPAENHDCMLRKVMGYIGELRNTFYGETWDVKSMAQSKNVAYTDLDLGLHMDLLYSADPPRFQALHCLRNRVEGGASYFVDSFASARRLARTHPHHVALLTKTKLRYEYDNDDHYLSWQHLVLPPNLSTPYAVVNWSPPFQAMRRAMHRRVTTGEEAEAVVEVDARCFDALQAWEAELRRPEHAYEFTMREGDLVLFDNRRILHARRGFRDLSEEESKERGVEIVPGEPTRWLKGCYLNGEVVWDKLVVLNNRVRGGLPMPEASWEEVDEEQEVD